MTSRKLALFLLLQSAAALAACSGEQAETARPAEPTLAADSAPVGDGRVFERNVVFLTPNTDSMLLVPWLFTARTEAGLVRREARGLLGRAETWDAFFSDAWETPPTRTPWRVLPRGSLRLVVGPDDAIEDIVFDSGQRQLDVSLNGLLVEWSGQRGETVRLRDGSVVLSGTRVRGLVLDLSRGRESPGTAGGDWAFLVDDDSLRLVLHAPEFVEPGSSGGFRSWALLGGEELEWPNVTVAWTETRAFEDARRNVPVEWSASSSTGDLRVELTVRAAEIRAGYGEGPQLPVDAVFDVEGTVRIGEDSYPVRGLLRHSQP